MINVLLGSLMEVIAAQKDLESGQIEPEIVLEAKKRFTQALNQYVDYRVQLSYEQRRKQVTQERIALADSINNAMQSTAHTVRSMAALTSAPPPPDTAGDHDAMEKWVREYNDWYEQKRERGLKMG
jgi:hypothetical protein